GARARDRRGRWRRGARGRGRRRPCRAGLAVAAAALRDERLSGRREAVAEYERDVLAPAPPGGPDLEPGRAVGAVARALVERGGRVDRHRDRVVGAVRDERDGPPERLGDRREVLGPDLHPTRRDAQAAEPLVVARYDGGDARIGLGP